DNLHTLREVETKVSDTEDEDAENAGLRVKPYVKNLSVWYPNDVLTYAYDEQRRDFSIISIQKFVMSTSLGASAVAVFTSGSYPALLAAIISVMGNVAEASSLPPESQQQIDSGTYTTYTQYHAAVTAAYNGTPSPTNYYD